MQIVKTVCGMCGADNCGIDVHVADGHIVKITGMREHPVNSGRLCPQAVAGIDLAHDPDRLKYPLRRTGDGWKRISWDAALDIVAEKLQRLGRTEGPQALAVYQGRALLQYLRDGWAQRFINLYGSPNLVRNDHMCSYPTILAERLTYGSPTVYGLQPEPARCIVLWGSNPATSHIPFIWHDVLAAQRQGAGLIVVDPRRTQPAAKADLHLSPRPGTDLALALSFIHVIIKHALYDAEFVQRWTVGFDRLVSCVEACTPAWAQEVTGVPAEDIVRAAEMYACRRPAYLDLGNSMEHHSNSGQTLRALMILRSITGNLDVSGGHVLREPIPLADVKLNHRKPQNVRPLGSERYPVFVDMAGFVPGDVLTDAILDEQPYPIKMMIMGGGNPALSWPNSGRVRQALAKLDFLAVMDIYMTATARLADLVLPAASAFERTQLIVRAGPYGVDRPGWYVMLRKQALDPGERRSDLWFWTALGRRMGYAADYPWATDEEAIDYQLEPLQLSVSTLLENPGGVYYGKAPVYRKYLDRGFATPSGKVELHSAFLETQGYHGLPDYAEPAESPVSAPDVAASYPLVLCAGRKSAVYTNSRHRNLPSLRRVEPEPLAEIHPVTAGLFGVTDRDWIRVQSPRGTIELRARVTEDIHPGVVNLLHGWEEADANALTDDRICDPMLSCPPLRAGLCRVTRIDHRVGD